jgi:hypothetical protein
MAKVKLGLQKLNPDETVALGNTIKTAMTGNPNFPAPNPPLTTVGAVITALQTKVATANSARAALNMALADRDAALVAARAVLQQEADYVQNVSGGDKTKIESAGMSVRDDGSPIGTPAQVLNLVVMAGDNDGTLDASWDRMRGVASYEVQVSVDPITATSWSFKQTASKSSATIGGLTSGAKMWVRVRAVGSGNVTGPWSDPATKVVP